MKKGGTLGLLVVGFFMMLLALLSIFHRQTLSQQDIPQRHIILGAWTDGLFDATVQKMHPEKLIAFQTLIQKKVSIAHYYIGWEALTSPNLLTQVDILSGHGWTPMISTNPYYFSQCPATNIPLYKAIADGACDNFLHKAAQNIRQTKRPFYLLFAWEMNNPDHEWSVSYTGSSSSDFVLAWRHIHEIFTKEKATNVMWVFCPNVPDDAHTPYSSLYPGDAYVDWVGLDGYNWGTTQSWSQWTSFSGVFTGAYKTLTTLAPTKPVMLAEVNTTAEGGDKGAWYTDMFAKQLPYHFPKIDAIIIFNEDKSAEEHVNWKVDDTPNALRGFITGVHTEFY